MKTLRLLMVPVAFSGGMATTALADSGTLTSDELQSLLDSASQYGFTHYEEISTEDDSRLELEGWRDDGWHLDVDMLVEDGSLVHEAQRKSEIPDWSLTAEEVEQALANAYDAGLQRFEQLDVDREGHLEIEGYTAQNREIEIRLNSDDLSITGVKND